jgi:hypothetical protein
MMAGDHGDHHTLLASGQPSVPDNANFEIVERWLWFVLQQASNIIHKGHHIGYETITHTVPTLRSNMEALSVAASVVAGL